jgi:hypothetical protein
LPAGPSHRMREGEDTRAHYGTKDVDGGGEEGACKTKPGHSVSREPGLTWGSLAAALKSVELAPALSASWDTWGRALGCMYSRMGYSSVFHPFALSIDAISHALNGL